MKLDRLHIISLVVIGILILLYVVKPNKDDGLSKSEKREYEKEIQEKQKSIDSINKLREKDFEAYNKGMEKMLMDLNIKDSVISKAKKNKYDANKARNNYFDSDIDERINTLTDNAQNDSIRR